MQSGFLIGTKPPKPLSWRSRARKMFDRSRKDLPAAEALGKEPEPHESDRSTSRLEAFSDGVMAIILTIMVLEIRPPDEPTLESLRPLVPILLSYVLSFTIIGICWNNHHQLLKATRNISGGVMWANLHLLFWLSLLPFGTAWIGEEHAHT